MRTPGPHAAAAVATSILLNFIAWQAEPESESPLNPRRGLAPWRGQLPHGVTERHAPPRPSGGKSGGALRSGRESAAPARRRTSLRHQGRAKRQRFPAASLKDEVSLDGTGEPAAPGRVTR